MRVLHAIANLSAESGGPAKAAVEMAAAIARRGHEVKILATDFGGPNVPLAAAQRDGVEIQTYPVQFPRQWKRSRPLARALAREVPKSDVVHVSSLYLYHDWIAGDLCARHKVPYLVRPHGTLDPYLVPRSRCKKLIMNLAFQNRVMRQAAAIHYTAKEEMILAEPYSLGTPGVVVPLGLTVADFQALPDPESLRVRYPEVGQRPIVLFLSRLHQKKGLDVLIPAFAKVVAAGHDLQLMIVGPDGGMERSVRGWVRDHGLESRVTMTGMLDGDDKLAAYGAGALFVLPSYTENFGLVVIEALACGLPVLISDKVNIWRELKELDAALVTPAEVAPVANAMIEYFSDQALRDRLHKAARPAAAQFDSDKMAIELESVYEDVIAGRIARTN